MPASVASLLNVVDVLNLSIDAFGLPLSCLQLDSFFDQLLFLVVTADTTGTRTRGKGCRMMRWRWGGARVG